MSDELRHAMETAAERIRPFHELQPLPNWETTSLGGRLGQRVTPIEQVGVYVPGGTAPLPSSLLMSVIPAQVAGVQQIVVCTPPNPHPAILGRRLSMWDRSGLPGRRRAGCCRPGLRHPEHPKGR